MAKTLIVTLTDDIDGSPAEETVKFSLDGRSYEIDLSKSNAENLRKALDPFLEKATSTGRAPRAAGKSAEAGRATVFSQLTDDEKAKYRKWAKAPNARRIADAKVEEWKAAGKP